MFINEGKVVHLLEKDGQYEPSECPVPYDTATEEPSRMFKVGDDYTLELYEQYNHDIFVERGWI